MGFARDKNWNEYVAQAEHVARGAGFCALREQILKHARLGPGDTVVDVGAGTGLLALAAAPKVERVLAIDIAPAMCGQGSKQWDRQRSRRRRVSGLPAPGRRVRRRRAQ